MLLCVLTGCAGPGQQVEKTMKADRPLKPPSADVTDPYRLGCPDEFDLIVADRPGLTGRHVVGPDGRVDLGRAGRVRIEGKTSAEAAAAIAAQVGVSPSAVRVVVQAYRSQKVYLLGEVQGLQRSVPYQGPERVVELLQRVGGLTGGAELGNVYLVRSHVTAGKSPEVFRVDVSAIVMKHDQSTNYVVEPFDEISVGERPSSSFSRSLPPWLLPIYQTVFGLEK
jgi:polysaccharide export outer membrane protein